jgi:hypothetical protein
MVRAAQPMPSDENFAPIDNSMSAHDPVLTTLRSANSAQPHAATAAGSGSMDSVSAVATAFLTNLSGGAACYDVDLRMVAEEMLTEQLLDMFASVQREMTFADAANWRLKTSTESTATVVAMATTGSGVDSCTQLQEFTLHIDLTAARPIISVDVHERSRFP